PRRVRQTGLEQQVDAVGGRSRVLSSRLEERRVLRLRRGRAARAEVPEDPEAAAHECLSAAREVVCEAKPRTEVALRVRLQVTTDLDAVDDCVVRGDDELARRL